MKIRTIEAARAWRAGQREILSGLRALLELPVWAELDGGTAIEQGARVRFRLKTYECVNAHAKALARSPLNGEYWKEAAE